jgi:hypothetical protein
MHSMNANYRKDALRPQSSSITLDKRPDRLEDLAELRVVELATGLAAVVDDDLVPATAAAGFTAKASLLDGLNSSAICPCFRTDAASHTFAFID